MLQPVGAASDYAYFNVFYQSKDLLDDKLCAIRQKLKPQLTLLNLSRPAQQFTVSGEWHQTYEQSFPVLFPQARK